MKIKTILAIILVFGLTVRLIGAFHGFPFSWDPDEWRIVLDTLAMGQKMTILSQNVDYPLFFKYILLLIYGFGYIVSRFFGLLSSTTEFAAFFFRHPEYFLIVPRILNSLLGLGVIYMAYLVGKKYFGNKEGILSALFVAIEFQLVVHGQEGVHQTLATLTILTIFYFIKELIDKPNIKNSSLLGIFIGLAVSSHHTTVLIFPSLMFVMFALIKNYGYKKIIPLVFRVGLLSFIFGSLGNLNWIFTPLDSLSFLIKGSGFGKIAFSSQAAYIYTPLNYLYWLIKEIVFQDYLLGVLMVLSLVFAIYRRKIEDLAYLIFFAVYILFFYNWAYRQLHLVLSLLPIMAIYASALFVFIVKKLKISTLVTIFCLIIVIIPSLYSLIWATEQRLKSDTRSLTKKWIEANIGTDKKIALDWPAYNINLNSYPPAYLRNQAGKDYFYNSVNNKLKDAILSLKPNYNLIEATYDNSEPIWPSNMPAEKIAEASKNESVKFAYKYFNFLTLDQVSSSSDYLIISSYSYSMYLLNNDPNKTDLFNVYLKDNVSDFYSHSTHPGSDKRHEYLFYLAKRGRDFYEPILKKQDPRFVEVKKFIPGDVSTGPIIIIYKIVHSGETQN